MSKNRYEDKSLSSVVPKSLFKICEVSHIDFPFHMPNPMAENNFFFFKIPAWDWALVGLLYQIAHPQANLMGQNKKKSEDHAFLHTFCEGVTENKWNDPTVTTRKKTVQLLIWV